MLGVSTSPFHISMLRKSNTWYTVKDGNWFDPTVWRSNGSKRYLYPQPNDDVVISHKILFDYQDIPGGPSYTSRVQTPGNTVRNLCISSSGIFNCTNLGNQVSFFVKNNVQCDGTFDWSGGFTNGGLLINIGGTNNWFNNFVPGNSSSNITVYYVSQNSFAVPRASYYSLEVGGGGMKWIDADMTMTGTLVIDSGTQFELGSFNFTAADMQNSGLLTKSSGTGTFNMTAAINGPYNGAVSFTSNPTINWTGNFACDTRNGMNFGTGTFNFWGNCTLALSASGNPPTNFGPVNVVIAAGKTVTVIGQSAWAPTAPVTGASGTSTLLINSGYCYLPGITDPMATGVFTYNNSGTSHIYVYASRACPQTSYYQLTIDNSALVTLSGNTTVSNSFSIGSGTMDFGSNNFSVGGTTQLGGYMICSGNDSTLSFKAIQYLLNGGLNFSAGNPTINLSGNITGDVRNGFNSGSGTLNVTGSMSIGVWTSSNLEGQIGANIVIGSGVTLTNICFSPGGVLGTGGINLIGTITGVDSTSIFVNNSVFDYNDSGAPMQTGVLDAHTNANIFVYNRSGNQDILAATYKNLTLQNSGAKRLLGNVSVQGVYTLTSSATLNSNGFALTNP